MFRNVSRPLDGRWPCTLPRLLAEMARTIPPRQKDGATTGRGAGEGYPNSCDGAYATHLLVGVLPRQGQPGRCVDDGM